MFKLTEELGVKNDTLQGAKNEVGIKSFQMLDFVFKHSRFVIVISNLSPSRNVIFPYRLIAFV
jgi:hypothetical protein